MALNTGSGIEIRHGSRSNGLASHLAVLSVFVVLSVMLTYPLAKDLDTRIPGAPRPPGDNFYYLYKVWWFGHALFDLHVSPFFNPNIFYPFGYDETLSETTLSNTVPALPLTLFFGEVVAYNLVMLISFVLSGFGTYLLVLRLTGSRAAGLLSGIVFAFCPYRMAHLGAGHLPLMGTQWLPLLFLYLERMLVRRRSADAVMAALFYTLGALSAWYYAYIFAMAGVVYVLACGRPWRQHLWQWRFARCALIFAIVCLLLVGPFALPVTRVWKGGTRPQSLHYLDHWSASPLDFIYPNVMHPLWGTWLLEQYPQNIYENMLFLGLVPLLLSIVALWGQRDRVRTAVGWLSATFAVMALGTTLHWKNAAVYIAVPGWLERMFTVGMGFLTNRLALYPISSWDLRVEGAVYLPLPTLLLVLNMPLFKAMRVWGRLGLITVFGVSVLAGCGLQRLYKRLCQRGTGAHSIRLRNVLVTMAVFMLVVLESLTVPFALGGSKTEAQPVDLWLAQQGGDFAVMVYPFDGKMGLPLYSSRFHGKKVSFGKGTFWPRAFLEQQKVLASFPSRESVALLKRWEVRYVLVGARSYGEAWRQLEQDLSAASGLGHVLTLDGVPIYEGDRILHLLPGTERAFIVDRTYVYEVL